MKTGNRVRCLVWSHIEDQVRIQVWDRVWILVRDQAENLVWYRVWDQVRDQVLAASQDKKI